MSNLEGRLADAFATEQPCWFPGLADELITAFWAETNSDPATYTTEVWLGSGSTAPSVPIPGVATMQLEPVPAHYAERFPAPSFAAASQTAPRAIADALKRLEASGAGCAVTRLIRSVHCIEALGPGYDCSHSEPSLPFSVFVSVPCAEPDGGLRLAESLLHEAMHLQLTLIERHVALTCADAGGGYSPWQQQQRPILGLVHGLYVFAAIHRWLTALTADLSISDPDRAYAHRRLRKIDEEIAQVTALASAPGLTSFGRALAECLLGATGVSPIHANGHPPHHAGVSSGR